MERSKHIQRILDFTKLSMKEIPKPTDAQHAAYDNSFAILLFNIEETSATSWLAEAISLVSHPTYTLLST